MSVLVKGMKMPDSCYHCKIAESCGHYITNYTDRRHPDCPLIALPDHHGRLVDADALEKEGWSLHRTIRVDMNTSEYQTKPLKQVPTIEPEPQVVRCKDCKNRGDDDCPMRFIEWVEYDDDGYIEYDDIIHDYTKDDGFCDRAERRTDEGD